LYYELLEKISRTLEIEPLLRHIGQAVVGTGLVDGLAILLKDPHEAVLRYELIELPPELADISRAYYKLGAELSGRDESAIAYSENRTIKFDAFTIADAHAEMQNRFVRWRMNSLFIMPLRHDDEPIGTLLMFRTTGDVEEPAAIAIRSLVERFTTQILNSASHSLLTEKVHAIESASIERRRFLEFISELNNLTASEQIFQMIADEFLRRYPFDLAFFHMIDGDRLAPECFRVARPELEPIRELSEDYYRRMERFEMRIEQGTVPLCASKNVPVYVKDARKVMHLPMAKKDKDILDLLAARGTPMLTLLNIPISRNRKPIGVLTLESMRDVVDLPDSDVDFIKLLCSFMGPAIEYPGRRTEG
jgi:transcriptional regulator with GAF, ATPase, and Fis domain